MSNSTTNVVVTIKHPTNKAVSKKWKLVSATNKRTQKFFRDNLGDVRVINANEGTFLEGTGTVKSEGCTLYDLGLAIPTSEPIEIPVEIHEAKDYLAAGEVFEGPKVGDLMNDNTDAVADEVALAVTVTDEAPAELAAGYAASFAPISKAKAKKMNSQDLRNELTRRGVDWSENAKNADLRELLIASGK